jgi:hypothetical protein
MTRLIHDCNLIDIVARKPLVTGFSTYQRGRNIIDYCLMDASLVKMITRCGYEPFNANIVSDHRGIFVDFSSTYSSTAGFNHWLRLLLGTVPPRNHTNYRHILQGST